MADLPARARDAAYVALGLGVLAFQKAQVRRREIAAELASRRAQAAAQFDAVSNPAGRRR